MKTAANNDDPLFHRVQPGFDPGAAGVPGDTRAERHVLLVSVYGALFFAVLGVVWGVVIRSQMLVFDGIYSFVSVLMASLSVYVAGTMKTRDDDKFPMGRSQLEPMVMILKALVLLVVCIGAFGRGMIVLFSGGRETHVFSAMIYGLIGIVACLGFWFYISRQGKKARWSGLVRAESMQWLADTLLSVVVFLGFLAAYLIQHGEHAGYARYADPLMVVVAALFFSVVPVASLVRGVKDVLLMAPDGNVYRVSRQVLEETARKHRFDGFVLRIVKAGRTLVYEVGFVSDDPQDARSLGDLDDIRAETEGRLKALYDHPIWLDVSFMHDRKWG